MTPSSSPIALHMLSCPSTAPPPPGEFWAPHVEDPSIAVGDGLRSTVPLVARDAIAQTQPCGTVHRSIHRARVVSNHQQFLSAPASSPPRTQQTSTTVACVEQPRAPVSQTQPRGQRPGTPGLPGVHFPGPSAAEKETSKWRAVPSGPPEVQPRVRGDHTNISLFKDGLEKLNSGTIHCEDTRDRNGCGTCQEPKCTCWSCSCKRVFLITVGRRRGGTNCREDTCERNPCGCRQSHTKCTCCTCGCHHEEPFRKLARCGEGSLEIIPNTQRRVRSSV